MKKLTLIFILITLSAFQTSSANNKIGYSGYDPMGYTCYHGDINNPYIEILAIVFGDQPCPPPPDTDPGKSYQTGKLEASNGKGDITINFTRHHDPNDPRCRTPRVGNSN